MRKLVLPLVLACAWVQLLPPSPVLVSLLMLAIHRSDHAHTVSLVADEGHLHYVLSHGERGAHAHQGAPHHGDRATPSSEKDHTVHVAGGDAHSATPRRVGHPSVSPSAVAVAFALLPTSSATSLLRRSPEPHTRSSDTLRATVLRL